MVSPSSDAARGSRGEKGYHTARWRVRSILGGRRSGYGTAPAYGVLGGSQAEDARLDQAADIAERAAAFQTAGRASRGVEAVDCGAVGSEHAPVAVDRDAAHRIGDPGADRDGKERRNLDRQR